MSTPTAAQKNAVLGSKTAMITGASSGLGAIYAQRLAAQGCDLVLVARREDRLRSQAEELTKKYGVSVEVLTADLADRGGIEGVAARVTEIPHLEFLVNNAGFGTMGDFLQVDPNRHCDMIMVHVLASMRLSHAGARSMAARGRGFIINVSSLAGFMTYPGSANYSATKAYLNSFSESLQAELSGTGVRVQALCPGFTRTGFHDTEAFKDFDRSQIPAGLWMSADEVVDISLRELKSGRVICIPGLKNRVFRRLFSLRVVRNLAGRRLRKKAGR